MQRAKKWIVFGGIAALCVGIGVSVIRADGRQSPSASDPKAANAATQDAQANHDDHDDEKASGAAHGEGDDDHKDHAGEAKSGDEERVTLTDAQQAAAGIEIKTAAAAQISEQMELPGEVRFNEDRTAHVVPRVPGVVERVNVSLGQQVKRGDVLAVLSSTQVSEQRAELLTAQERRAGALKTYEREKMLWEEKISAEQDFIAAQQSLREADIAVRNARQKLSAVGAGAASGDGLNRIELRAPFDGTVVEKHAALGEAVTETANLFTLSDMGTVWAEIAVPSQSLGVVRVGTPVTVRSTAFDSQAKGTVAYVGSLLGEQTRTAKARVSLENPDRLWRPGVFVNVFIGTSQVNVPVAVAETAIQTVEGRTVVFVKTVQGFVATPVKTGRRDDTHVEIVSGLAPDTPYVAANSFVLKAELGKSTAEHSH
ncbi:efflux transporter periplasmic adaptor subunit [Pandoraea iniqua]|uniref:efflux RND transporter periplasmic adaptor subunit n=1 Tax=Pandoraea iniqua TaxID=2508288 RepID=UPI001258CF58|nr:efflux RND transporter periplasmic adaptor subunit [Pandoraea iniqua]VVE07981.1 efflux transporter periplasmic adaptor subunit [Pandoraea iniqua]